MTTMVLLGILFWGGWVLVKYTFSTVVADFFRTYIVERKVPS